MASFAGKNDGDKLKALSQLKYKDQAVWFLNAFWAGDSGPQFGANEDEAERIWKFWEKAVEIDAKSEEGNELNEFDAHRLLEAFDSSLTVQKMREVLQDIDVDFNKMVSLTEFMIYKYSIDWKALVNAPQGEEDKEAVAAAAAKVEAAQEALKNVQASAQKAREEEKEAAGKEAEAKAAEEEAAKAKAVADEALAELNAQEEAFKSKMEKLEATSTDGSLGIVKRNKAKAELAQLKCEDPLPLRQAKITQEAAVRKLQKALKKAASAAAAAGAARKNAAAAAEEAEAAIPLAEAAFEEAQQILAEVKEQIKGAGQGTFWWMDRELVEAMKYMPQKKRLEMEKKMAAAKAEREAKA
eukprot:g2295.t1